jgi:hypothetical protein
MNSFNQTTLQSLLTAGAITQVDIDKLQRKALRVTKKAGAALRHEDTVKLVRVAFNELTAEGVATQHRAVWNKVGRHEFERDEVLNALKTLRDSDEARTYKLSNNNFQVFWAQPVPEVTEDENGEDVIPGVDEV